MMEPAIEEAIKTINKNFGGPFGAVITDKEGKIIAISSNTVLRDNDSTAHAEINAIRVAEKSLKTHNLEGCILYTTCYPCPMCMGAILWANIQEVYYGCDAIDAAKIGFKDDYIYKYIESGCHNEQVLKITQINRDKCIKLFEEYDKKNKEIY
ncbi:MAG: nucleoside deaminase [Clostridia bacterium]|nr:nucleoside deaminase [Clostridia bacterium]